jgi:hypothetical protein
VVLELQFLCVRRLQVEKVVIPPATEKRPEQQFGFIHFNDQASASKAVAEAKAEKPELLGKTLEVSFAGLLGIGRHP